MKVVSKFAHLKGQNNTFSRCKFTRIAKFHDTIMTKMDSIK